MSISPGYIAYQLAKGSGDGMRMPGPEIKRGAEILDGPYPKSFADFIGQENARLQIIAAVNSAAVRGESMDHMLIASGTPGIGKTTLARLAASLRGAGFVELGGSVTDKDAAKALKVMEDGDVLFLDEIHRLVSGGKARAEWLLTLLQDGVLHTPGGVVQAPKITVIAATTDKERLPKTILERFPIVPVLDPYTDREAVQIGLIAAKRLGFGADHLPLPADNTWLAKVAKASANNPRRMGNLLASVRDVALSTNNMNLHGDEGYDLTVSLEWAGLTEDGLDRSQQNYMVALLLAGGTAGISTLKARLGEDQIQLTERYLIHAGYVDVTPQGRVLTDFGRERAVDIASDLAAAHVAREKKEAALA